jgi:hypothetical protein
MALRGFDKFAGSEFGRTQCARRAETRDGFGQSHPHQPMIRRNLNALGLVGVFTFFTFLQNTLQRGKGTGIGSPLSSPYASPLSNAFTVIGW